LKEKSLKGSSLKRPKMTRNLIPQILSQVKRTIYRHQMISTGEAIGIMPSLVGSEMCIRDRI